MQVGSFLGFASAQTKWAQRPSRFSPFPPEGKRDASAAGGRLSGDPARDAGAQWVNALFLRSSHSYSSLTSGRCNSICTQGLWRAIRHQRQWKAIRYWCLTGPGHAKTHQKGGRGRTCKSRFWPLYPYLDYSFFSVALKQFAGRAHTTVHPYAWAVQESTSLDCF